MPPFSIRPLVLLPVALAALLAAYLLLWPVSVDPARWRPAEAPPLAGDFAPNDYLAQTERLLEGVGKNPEDIAFDQAGRLYAGFDDGRIVRWTAADGVSDFAFTGGRPLGLRFDAAGTLYVADAIHGLLSVAPDGAVTILTNTQGGLPFRFTDDLDIAADGVVYFSDASWKFGPSHFLEDLIEHRPNGRLLAYDPRTAETRLVLGDLHFANGVAVAPDQSYVLVAETGKYLVRRYWLAGEKAGTSDVFIDNLPGFPDGITTGADGSYWVPLAYPRDPLLDGMMPVPFLRKALLRLPAWLRPAPVRHGFVLGIDGDGRIVHNLQGPGTAYAPITNVVEHDGHLYFGSIDSDAVGRVALPS